jgi:hypothetical protein
MKPIKIQPSSVLMGAALLACAWLLSCASARTPESCWWEEEYETWSSGRRVCLICGASERRVTSEGEVIAEWDSAGEGSEAETVLPYAAWYAMEIGRPHEHSWWGVGCHVSHGPTSESVSCSQFGGIRPWFTTLPALVDDEIAEHLLLRLAHADGEERLELLEGVAMSFRNERPLWGLLRSPEAAPAERMGAFARWTDDNPLWRLFDERWADPKESVRERPD